MVTGPTLDGKQVLAALQQMVAEEMHLLGLELEDSLEGGQIVRLEQLTQMLDEARDLIISHRVPNAAR